MGQFAVALLVEAELDLALADRDRLGDVAEIAVVDVPAKREGRYMSMILGPRPEVLKKLKDSRAAKDAAKKSQQKKSKGDDQQPEQLEEQTAGSQTKEAD